MKRRIAEQTPGVIQMNPYETPTQSSQAKPVNEIPTRGGFRWGVIPAAISWCIGAVALVALPVGIYQNSASFFPEDSADWPPRMMSYAAIATIPAMLAGGSLYLLAGFLWARGRWCVALTLNAVGYALFCIPEAMHKRETLVLDITARHGLQQVPQPVTEFRFNGRSRGGDFGMV